MKISSQYIACPIFFRMSLGLTYQKNIKDLWSRCPIPKPVLISSRVRNAAGTSPAHRCWIRSASRSSKQTPVLCSQSAIMSYPVSLAARSSDPRSFLFCLTSQIFQCCPKNPTSCKTVWTTPHEMMFFHTDEGSVVASVLDVGRTSNIVTGQLWGTHSDEIVAFEICPFSGRVCVQAIIDGFLYVRVLDYLRPTGTQ